MANLTEEEIYRMNELQNSIKFNHPDESGKFMGSVDESEELENYRERITKFSLPNRFGMYRPTTQVDGEKQEDIQIDDPEQYIFPELIPNENPDHKIRPIFS